MRVQLILIANIEQLVQKTTVGKIDLGRLDLSLAQVLVPRLEHADHEGRNHVIEVAANGGVAHTERTRKLGAVPGLAVVVREHGPESAQDRRRHANAKLREITFKEVSHEVATPFEAGSIGGRQECAWKTTAQPKAVEKVETGLVQGESGQVMVGDTASQRFCALPKECRRGAAEHEESARFACAIDKDAQTSKDF